MARPAPSTVSRAGLISKGSMMLIPNRTSIPKECGPTFFNGNTDIFQVPDTCCTAAAGAEEWLPLSKFGSYKGIDGCKLVDPFDDGKIQAELVNGCYDDGTQYYGEKCGASDFGEATADAHGDCGPAEGSCTCNKYFTTKTPGCFVVATPDVFTSGVYVRAEGCAST